MMSMEGKTILITGANTGIGRVTARELARQGARLYVACRSVERTAPVLEELRMAGAGSAEMLTVDLGDLMSVRACAEAFLAREPRLHVLINNAGLAGHRGVTRDGFEIAFGVNHLGHFLLTELLMDALRAGTPSRIVNVSSQAHYRAKGIDWEALRRPTRTLTGMPEYDVSKLCNVLHAKELARRLEGTRVHTYALHPGVIASDVWRRVPWPVRPVMTAFMKSNEEGAQTSLYCATSEAVAEHTGRYYDDCREKEPSEVAKDAALAEELRQRSAEWVGL
jgi:retinol dehydrogenase 12